MENPTGLGQCRGRVGVGLRESSQPQIAAPLGRQRLPPVNRRATTGTRHVQLTRGKHRPQQRLDSAVTPTRARAAVRRPDRSDR